MALRPSLTFGLAVFCTAILASAHAAPNVDSPASGSARGQLLVIDPEGNDDNPCTVREPCQTFQHAAAAARPGDQVWALGGVYPSQQISGNAAFPLSIRGVPGTEVMIEGSVDVSRPLVSIRSLSIAGTVSFQPGSAGSRLLNSRAEGFNIFGADGIVVSGNVLDGGGVVPRNLIYDKPAGSTPDGWRITNNTLRNYYDGANSEAHTEALYVGHSTNGLISGNTFTNNGNTSHVFFTWFGHLADSSSSYPKNVCVRANTFGPTHGAYYALNFREEIPASTGIRVDPSNVGATTTNHAFDRRCRSDLPRGG